MDVEAPIDYVVVGHLTHDITPTGAHVGGTVSYAAATALALGMRVGVITSWDESLPLERLNHVPIINRKVEHSTTFKNVETEEGRQQTIYHVAENLEYSLIPLKWQKVDIVHLGPVVHEVDAELAGHFSGCLVGISPQGWLREWNGQGLVKPVLWDEFVRSNRFQALRNADAVVISLDDVARSASRVKEMAAICQILVVTEAEKGSRVYWKGQEYHFPAPKMREYDPIGAGDVYATAFFIRLKETQDVLEAARFATQIAAFSVTRSGLNSAPTPDEIEQCKKGVVD